MSDRLGYEPVTNPASLRRFFGIASGGTAAPTQLPLDGMAPVSAVRAPSRLTGERAPLGYGLFFAGFAGPDDSWRLCQRGSELARAHRLRNAVQAPQRAHVTLCSLNRHCVLDEAVIAAACAAADRLPCPELHLVFERAVSFAADGAFMLKGDATTDLAVARLREPLMRLLRRFGLQPMAVTTPHMTMVYNCGRVVAEHAMAPLPWTLQRFALVLSHIGNSRHEYLGEWTLPRG